VLIGPVVNLVVAFMATSAGTTNALGWSTVLIYLSIGWRRGRTA
jgi:hypothetical protein